MADPVTMLVVGSSVLGAMGAMQEGQAANEASKIDAAQLRENANQSIARGTREAEQEALIKRKNISDAEAQMAGQGGTTSSAGNVETLAKIEQVGEYNALSALYESEIEAEGYKKAAKQRRREGKQALRSARTQALTSLVSAGATAYGSFKAPAAPMSRSRQIGAGGRLPGESFGSTGIRY